ncbi:MAG: GUN4 domain-containing protein, partial [Dolichospermum sp.]
CQEQWKLSDFGLSRQMSDKSQSRTGNIAGSIAFMPPEAFGNESVVSTAWDMWSLGILGAALVDGGRLPFNYQSEMDLMLKIYQGDVKLPSRIPERLAPVVTNCLLKDRSKRWSAAQVIECLSNRNNTKASLKSDQVSNNAKSISSLNPLDKLLRENAAIQRRSVDTVPLKSESGVDYTRLRDLLKAGEWRDADKETYERMLQKHNRTNQKRSPFIKDSLLRTMKVGGRSLSSLEYFPSVDLKTINELWVKASGGRFGFSVQKDIYVNCGAKLDGKYPGDEIWYKFCEKVGWRGQENNGGLSYDRAEWLEYSLSLCFIRGQISIFTPDGLLPCVARWKEDEDGFGVLDHRRVIQYGYNSAYSLFSHRALSIN